MRRTVSLTTAGLLAGALALSASAGAQELGPATAASLRTVAKAHTTRGPLNPGRAATVLARMFRSAGDRPTQIGCWMSSPDTATCTIEVIRAGASWTGTGKVWQGRRRYRASYEISTSS
ncbi:MAG: hypothetical protein ABI950_00870 [Solirubrobacteraceae bacterium]